MNKDNEPHKVLFVAFLEESRPAAYEMIEALKKYGYSSDICFAKQNEEKEQKPDTKRTAGDEEPAKTETNLVADLYLNENTDLSMYDGVVFLDDGADAKSAISLAERADEASLAIGGYSHGCHVLFEAGLLKGKFVSVGLPKDYQKGSKAVNSPSVRSDNVVTSAGNCATGFIILFVDALGGEIRKVVESKSTDPLISPRSALVVSRLEEWSEYWELAERLAQKEVSLILADWDDIDAKRGVVKRHLALLPRTANKVFLVEQPRIIPDNIWFKQTSIGAKETIAAVAQLESIGCVNVNSSETIRTANDKMATARLLAPIFYQGDPELFDGDSLERAADKLMMPGTRWTKPPDDSLGRKVMKIQGNGKIAILSRRAKGGAAEHLLLDRQALLKTLKMKYNFGPFMVQNDLGSMHLGDKNFELRFIMRRGEKGWKSSAEIARAGLVISNPDMSSKGIKMYSCSARQILKTIRPEDWESKLAEARSVAETACIAFQSGLKNPDGANELGVDITLLDGQPMVIEINSVPGLAGVEHAARGKDGFLSLAYSLGTGAEPYDDVSADEVANSRGDVAEVLHPRINDQVYRRVVEREMHREGIYFQEEDNLAILENGKFEKMDFKEAFRRFKADVRYFMERFRESDDKYDRSKAEDDYDKASNNAMVARKALHRLRLLCELYYFETRNKEMVKTADYAFNFTGDEYEYGDGSVPGPYSRIRVPERVIPYRDDCDDWLKDTGQINEKDIWKLTRYHPETKDGFYAEFDLLHQNDPIPWEEVEEGRGDYPSRTQMMKHQ
jgi:glutathione synthase/RimK-type ligase-like ATP-grasp enzyme